MSSQIFWAILLILAGVVFLLNNLGLLPGSAWNYLWPLVLIAIGLSLLLAWRRSPGAATVSESVPLDGASRARLTVRHGAGQLRIHTGAPADLLLYGTFGGGVEKRVQHQGDQLDVSLQATSGDWTQWAGPWHWGEGNRREWNLGLNPGIPLTLAIESGAAENRLDLSGLRVTDLTLRTGASSTNLTLPAQAGYTQAKINTGAASVNLQVPAGVAARIRGTIGLGNLSVDQARFPRRDGGYESADFASAANRVELEIEGSVGSVTVR